MAGQLMLVNPKKRKKRRKSTKKTMLRSAHSRKRRRRKNPIRRNPKRRRSGGKLNVGNIVQNTIMPAATAAGGAIGIDILMGLMPLPENLKTGPMRHLVKGAAAIGAGMLAANFVKPKTAELFTTGALTVVMYDAGREMIQNFAPDMAARMGLSGMGLYYDDDELMGLGYPGAGYTGVDNDDDEIDGLGLYYDDEDEFAGLGQDDEIEEFEL